MQIRQSHNNQQQINSVNFKSYLVPSKHLNNTFFDCFLFKNKLQPARQYANALEGLLKDGRNDKLDFIQHKNFLTFNVNDKEYSRFNTESDNQQSIAKKIINCIIDFAAKERNIKKVENYDSLTQQEINYTKNNAIDFDFNGKPKYLDLINRYHNLSTPEDRHYKYKLTRLKQDIILALFRGTQNRLNTLREVIFNPDKKNLSYEDILKKVLNS